LSSNWLLFTLQINAVRKKPATAILTVTSKKSALINIIFITQNYFKRKAIFMTELKEKTDYGQDFFGFTVLSGEKN
jgi:hypothetical protein